MPNLATQEFLFIILFLTIPLFLINVFVFLFNQENFKTTLIRSGKVCLLLIIIFTLIALVFNLFLQHNNVSIPLNSIR
jgi:polyferredoxin